MLFSYPWILFALELAVGSDPSPNSVTILFLRMVSEGTLSVVVQRSTTCDREVF